MKTVHFYLVRHGQTRLNRLKRLQGVTNSRLTHKGREAARNLGTQLKDMDFEAVYTSDLKRTQDTANFILEKNRYAFDIQPLKGLREVDFGRLEEMKNKKLIPLLVKKFGFFKVIKAVLGHNRFRDLVDMFAELEGTSQAETYDSMTSRIIETLTDIGSQYQTRGGNILIVSHGLVLSSFIDSLEKNQLPIMLLKNASVSNVDFEKGKFKVVKINQKG
ncbi:histidine phosphatase family protein [Dellaglioa algida]|nr:histidine phosphatase family protein [Dellaglioa algida]MDK1719218.1 histidine phosphatase family protein [Dellaglioa algida]MDK1726073.1 histidine phosphatase family protein [Dellaglioa algida]MDK1727831.1 histidine phosphatase family protein [Dellaglioa algida]MDK1728914.1 histidine phosphatase family protein [Dellaglioa algida]MDK1732226.1 histidine phosphatase family protein [Dellaglioa algida]